MVARGRTGRGPGRLARRAALRASVTACALAAPVAVAQLPAPPAIPAPPKAPAIPTAPPAGVPALPGGLPAVPSGVPAAPAAPRAPKAGAVPKAPALPAEVPATAPPEPTLGPAEDTTVVVEEKPRTDGTSEVPLPKGLRQGGSSAPLAVEERERKGGGLTIEEIVNSPVVSASNRAETAASAPAFVVVITAADLKARGYSDLSQLLDDLPGMDVVRPYGDVYVKSYWRGYRPGAGADPYLLMLDGMVYNHLFFGDTQMLAAMPISSVERVEIVYGPASAVYGPNAEMGIINVITKDARQRQESGELGSSLDARLTFGGPQRNLLRFADATKIVDGTFSYVTRDWRLRLTTRVEDSVLDRSIGDDFEYTRPLYYAEPRLWGAPVLRKYDDMVGRFRSPDQKRAVDLRFVAGHTEIGAQLLSLSSGLGTTYAADRIQTGTPWTTNELGAFVRHSANLSASVTSATLVQFRRSDIASPSSNLIREHAAGAFDLPGPNFVAVQAPGSAIVVQQDFDVAGERNLVLEGDELAVGLGLKYQHRELSRAYQVVTDVTYPLDVPDPVAGAVDATSPSAASTDGRTRFVSDDIGAYLLGRYSFPPGSALHGGVRFDHSGLSDDSNVTFRGGYVGSFGDLTGKVLYGQAVYTPGAFDLSRATGKLKEERSQTLEANAQYTLGGVLVVSGDMWNVRFSDAIIAGGANGTGTQNLGTRRITGADLGARLAVSPVQLWAYYSRYLSAEESGADGELHPIGDLARDKVWGGATYARGSFSATLLGRWIGPRDPVVTNPLGTVPSYFTLDANVVVSHLYFEGLWLGARVTNLLDARYAHPGLQTAGSGATPGVWTGTSYVGSLDDFNSRLPQPRRGIYLTLGLDL